MLMRNAGGGFPNDVAAESWSCKAPPPGRPTAPFSAVTGLSNFHSQLYSSNVMVQSNGHAPSDEGLSFRLERPITLDSPILAFANTAEQQRSLREAHMLHILATDPSSVLPPSKSLASIFAQTVTVESSKGTEEAQAAAATLEDKVGGIVKRAFWDEV